MYTPKDKKGVPQLTIEQPVPSVLNDTPFYKENITDNSEKINTPDKKSSDRSKVPKNETPLRQIRAEVCLVCRSISYNNIIFYNQ